MGRDVGRGVWDMAHIPGIASLAPRPLLDAPRVGETGEPRRQAPLVPPVVLSCAGKRRLGSKGRGRSSSQTKLAEMTEELAGYAALDVRELGRLKAALWKSHTDHNKQLVLDAAALVKTKDRCVIVGAGPCYDIPLQELAALFDEVELLDLNPASLAQAAGDLPEELAARVKFTALEMTHALPKLLYTIKQEFGKAGSRSQRALNKAVGALNKQTIGPGEFAQIQGDLIISDMILTQLPTSLWLVDDWYQGLFGKSLADDMAWMQAMIGYSERLQSAHVDGLLSRKGAVVVLSTDFGVAETPEEANLRDLDSAGRVTLGTSTIHKIMALQEAAAIERTWVWHRDDTPAKFSPVWGLALAPT